MGGMRERRQARHLKVRGLRIVSWNLHELAPQNLTAALTMLQDRIGGNFILCAQEVGHWPEGDDMEVIGWEVRHDSLSRVALIVPLGMGHLIEGAYISTERFAIQAFGDLA